MASRKGSGPRRPRTTKSEYFTQPGKGATVVVLRKPCGNRATPKICGVMPSRVHAKMLITQLEKAESVVSDLFLEATDDGIEALEAVLAACREEVLRKGPGARDRDGGGSGPGSGQPSGGSGRSRRPRGRDRGRGTPKFEAPAQADPTHDENANPSRDGEAGDTDELLGSQRPE